MVYMGDDSYISNVLHDLMPIGVAMMSRLRNFNAKLLIFWRIFTIFALVSASYPKKEVSATPPIVIGGRIESFRTPIVMGILNVTPDSFFASSRVASAREAAGRVGRMLEEGADIIDIGACSTRPGSDTVSYEDEMSRLEGALEEIRASYPEALISVDTFRARIAAECIERWNVAIINDVSGGKDPEMFPVVASNKAAYVLMHSRSTPKEMDSACAYSDVVADVTRELAFRLDEARRAGVCNVIVDPGFGFAKTTAQNFELLSRLDWLKVLGCPLLAGISRKRMALPHAGAKPEDALATTVALNTVALMKGAAIIRVHDVKEAVQTVGIFNRLWISE